MHNKLLQIGSVRPRDRDGAPPSQFWAASAFLTRRCHLLLFVDCKRAGLIVSFAVTLVLCTGRGPAPCSRHAQTEEIPYIFESNPHPNLIRTQFLAIS